MPAVALWTNKKMFTFGNFSVQRACQVDLIEDSVGILLPTGSVASRYRLPINPAPRSWS